MSPGTISNLNRKIYEEIEKWRNEPLKNHYTYVYLDGIWLKRSWGGEVKNISVLVVIGVNVVGAFPDGNSALMLVAARLRHVAISTWSSRIYLNMTLIVHDLDSVA